MVDGELQSLGASLVLVRMTRCLEELRVRYVQERMAGWSADDTRDIEKKLEMHALDLRIVPAADDVGVTLNCIESSCLGLIDNPDSERKADDCNDLLAIVRKTTAMLNRVAAPVEGQVIPKRPMPTSEPPYLGVVIEGNKLTRGNEPPIKLGAGEVDILNVMIDAGKSGNTRQNILAALNDTLDKNTSNRVATLNSKKLGDICLKIQPKHPRHGMWTLIDVPKKPKKVKK